MHDSGGSARHLGVDRRVVATLTLLWCLFFAGLVGVPPDPDSFLDPDFEPRSASTFSDRLYFVALGQRDVLRSASPKDRKAITKPGYDPPAAPGRSLSVTRDARAALHYAVVCVCLDPQDVAPAFNPRGPPARSS